MFDRCLGIDVGTVRVGVARTVPGTSFTVPVATLRLDETCIPELVSLIEDYSTEVVFIGLPLHLSGAAGQAADMARNFALELQEKLGGLKREVPIRLVDERLSTSLASRQLRDSGKTSLEQRSIVDQQAAVMILQTALEACHNQGRLIGQTLADSAREG